MNVKLRKKILICLLIIICLLLITLLILKIVPNKNSTSNLPESEEKEVKSDGYVEEIKDGVKLNKSSKLNEAKQVDGLTITNIQLTTKDGMTTLLADVINNSGKMTELKTVQITLLDQKGNELTKLTGIIDGLESGKSTQLNIAMTSDYVNAYDFKVEVQK